MIIDKAILITDSFTFTKAAEEKNAENLLVIRSKELASSYRENWQRHKEHSERYEGGYLWRRYLSLHAKKRCFAGEIIYW